MKLKQYFKHLREELKENKYKERFLMELQEHTEDLFEDKGLEKELPLPDFIEKRLGKAEQVNQTFQFIMNPWSQATTLMLYALSLYFLFAIWGFVFNALLVPWDAATYRPMLGTLERTINDFFESYGLSYLLYLLLMTSFLIVVIRVLKEGKEKLYSILDYALISNFFYLALLIALSFIYSLLMPVNDEVHYNLWAIMIHLLVIIGLFWMQFTAFQWKKKEK